MDDDMDCQWCGDGCDGCSGPGEEWEDDEDSEPVEKKCETCGHTWWVSTRDDPEKQTKEPDTCFQCKYNDDSPDCNYCGDGTGCFGCSGPEEEMSDDDYYNQY